jgi:hypothetical protein
MRILRGLSSRFLACGCLAGVYETYGGEIVTIVDAKAPACADSAHEEGKSIPVDAPHAPSHVSPIARIDHPSARD